MFSSIFFKKPKMQTSWHKMTWFPFPHPPPSLPHPAAQFFISRKHQNHFSFLPVHWKIHYLYWLNHQLLVLCFIAVLLISDTTRKPEPLSQIGFGGSRSKKQGSCVVWVLRQHSLTVQEKWETWDLYLKVCFGDPGQGRIIRFRSTRTTIIMEWHLWWEWHWVRLWQ